MTSLRLLATALTFLTRLPGVARFAYAEPADLARSAHWWPTVGAALGLLAAGVYHLALWFWPSSIAALMTIASIAIITGAFHEDGLADSADGFFGGFSPERRLEIMKDSRIGTFGGLALIFHVALLTAALASMQTTLVLPALVWSHALARSSSLPLAYVLPYARDQGTNKPVAEGLSLKIVMAGMGSVLLWALALAWLFPAAQRALWLSAGLALIFWPLAGFYCGRKIQGITGDALGAINQLTFLFCLLVFSAK